MLAAVVKTGGTMAVADAVADADAAEALLYTSEPWGEERLAWDGQARRWLALAVRPRTASASKREAIFIVVGEGEHSGPAARGVLCNSRRLGWAIESCSCSYTARPCE